VLRRAPLENRTFVQIEEQTGRHGQRAPAMRQAMVEQEEPGLEELEINLVPDDAYLGIADECGA
jgi:hypothetical protein